MTINYTNLLGLAKPVTGTETGQWGDVVNDQITELIEDAVANASSISVTSGDVTLTTTTGSSNQARMAVLLITGSPGVSRNIIAPSQSKWYIVKNSSNASIVVKGSATTGVTILADTEALVFWNGSDFEVAGLVGPSSSTDNAVARFDSTTGKVIQNSGVTIDDSNNVSGVAQLNATTADLTNLEVTNIKAKDGTAAASIADSTGVISITSNPILSGGTANGVLYLNGSKVATSGSALTFDGTEFKVNAASGNVLIQPSNVANAKFYLRHGSIANNNGFEVDVSSNTIFLQAGSEAMRLTSTGLGVGTSSPSYKLDVSGEIRATSHVRGTGSDQLYLIGGASNNNNNIYIGGSSAGTANTIAFTTNGSERARITSGGDLLVGTTSNGGGARLKSKVAAGTFGLEVTDESQSDFIVAPLSGAVCRVGPSAGSMAFYTANSERARITSGGDFYINTTAAGGKFYVVSDLAANNGIRVDVPASFTASSIALISATAAGTGWFFLTGESSGGSARIQIRGDGNLYNANGTYGTISDARLKQDIVDAPSQWDDLKAVRFRKYRMKEDVAVDPNAPALLGVIAQELEQVCPGLVDEHTNTNGETIKTVKSSVLLMKAAVALQEAMVRIEQLEAKVAALESKGA